MSRKLKVGIAGYGVVGKRRCECVKQHPSLEIVAICDQVFTDDVSIVDGLRSYNNYKQLINLLVLNFLKSVVVLLSHQQKQMLN